MESAALTKALGRLTMIDHGTKFVLKECDEKVE